MGKIFYLMGKSSSGKDTIYQRLKQHFPQFKTNVLYTTRPMREGEKNGVDYCFIDDKKVEELEKAGKIIEKREYETVHGIWKYMTVDDANFDVENENYLMIGTLESFLKIKEYFGKDLLVPIYINVEDGERLMRAILREKTQKEPKYAELCRRFLADEKDFSKENLLKAEIGKIFNNENLDKCVDEIILYVVTRMNI